MGTSNTYPDKEEATSPSEYLWAMYMLGQHYARNFSTLQQAYDLINKCISHTNTISEIYIVKAEIEYRLHNDFEALQTIN